MNIKRSHCIFFLVGLTISTLVSCISSSTNQAQGNLDVGKGGGGQGGSMARFQLVGKYLYAMPGAYLQIFDISDSRQPVHVNQVNMGWDVETLFQYNGKMFVGSQTGMYIYDLANPLQPEYVSKFGHRRSCDPVVVQGEVAYVTLNGNGQACWNSENLLQVIDVSELSQPKLLTQINQMDPQGLGVDGDQLFVCDGREGVKVYDISNPTNPNLDQTVSIEGAYDVIPAGGLLLVIAKDGLYQFDYKGEVLKYLSRINIGQQIGT